MTPECYMLNLLGKENENYYIIIGYILELKQEIWEYDPYIIPVECIPLFPTKNK